MAEAFGGSLIFVPPVYGKNTPIHHDGRSIFADLPDGFPGGRYHSLAVDRMPDPPIAKKPARVGIDMDIRLCW